MFTRPRLDINLNRILENYICFSNAKTNPDTQMGAVVKDNAYGLGDQAVADILYNQGGCRVFFVAHGFEGHRIRSVAPHADIYVLQGPGKEDIKYFAEDNLIPVIASPAQLSFWNREKPNRQKPAIQIETGLNRLGFRLCDIEALSEPERNQFGLVLSHLACADEPAHIMNQKQLDMFQKLTSFFPKAQLSLSASDGFMLGAAYQFDIVRLGAVLYGLNPVPGFSLKSRNVIQVTAPILQIADVYPGDCIGYGADHIVDRPGKIAIVSIGYGDGVFRSFYPKGKVWFESDGQMFAAPMIGRVSMDNLICDVSRIPTDILNKSQYVTLINDYYTADDFGADAGTIGYEVISALGHGIRFIRTYSSKF